MFDIFGKNGKILARTEIFVLSIPIELQVAACFDFACSVLNLKVYCMVEMSAIQGPNESKNKVKHRPSDVGGDFEEVPDPYQDDELISPDGKHRFLILHTKFDKILQIFLCTFLFSVTIFTIFR